MGGDLRHEACHGVRFRPFEIWIKGEGKVEPLAPTRMFSGTEV